MMGFVFVDSSSSPGNEIPVKGKVGDQEYVTSHTDA